jgi:hypothetical protein
MDLVTLLLILILLGGVGGFAIGVHLIVVLLVVGLLCSLIYSVPRTGAPALPAYGYWPSGGLGLVLVVVLILALTGHI